MPCHSRGARLGRCGYITQDTTSRAHTGPKTREWQMDTVMIADQVKDDHVGFNLRFTKTSTAANLPTPTTSRMCSSSSMAMFGRTASLCPQVAGVRTRARTLPSRRCSARWMRLTVMRPKRFGEQRAYQLGISESEREDSRRKAFQRAMKALIELGKVVVKNKQVFDSGVSNRHNRHAIGICRFCRASS